MLWYCPPGRHIKLGESSSSSSERSFEDEKEGTWHVDNLDRFELFPPAKKDFWRKTYYDPVLLKDDGPFLYCALPLQNNEGAPQFYTIETSFILTAFSQFDQAGLMIRLDAEHWIKCGIEVVDRVPRLSCVVTNEYSDWSTQTWPECGDPECQNMPTIKRKKFFKRSKAKQSQESVEESSNGPINVTARLRMHCRGDNFVVEAKQRYKEWEFVRIAHMSRQSPSDTDVSIEQGSLPKQAWEGSSPKANELWAGVFACCPEDQKGCCAAFTYFTVSKGSKFNHHANETL